MNGIEALKRRQPFETTTANWEETPLPSALVPRRFHRFKGCDTDLKDRLRSECTTQWKTLQSAVLDPIIDDTEASTPCLATRLGCTQPTAVGRLYSLSYRKVQTRWVLHVLSYTTRLTLVSKCPFLLSRLCTERCFWKTGLLEMGIGSSSPLPDDLTFTMVLLYAPSSAHVTTLILELVYLSRSGAGIVATFAIFCKPWSAGVGIGIHYSLQLHD